MYVTTFYSYKGGVGRTMALVNVAVLLAQAGKRVLIVDFDLEAPGLPSFDLFRNAGRRAGIVDYVCAFRETGRSPQVGDFIVKCDEEGGLPIWLMPAGRHTQAGYADKLYSIDWKDLYDNNDGYLMFEDMRQQWSRHEAGFDYVLIDSRTGHTDVGGICTRQLPDSVVVMFLPNEQNIEGLKPIVAAIVAEEKIGRGEKIDLHFCPSNVPDLDDEDDILRDMLERARSSLGEPATVVHHYNSLDLLMQPAFAESRPNSKLARQYNELMNAIIERNFEDAAGAERALLRMPDRYERARTDGNQEALRDIEDSATQIASLHPENGRIGWLLSILYSRMGAVESELAALSLAIERNFERSRAIIRRARLLSSLDRKDDAVHDLHQLLGSGTATVFEILPAMDLLRAIDARNWVKPVQGAIEQLQANAQTYEMLMVSLMASREKLPLAVRVGQRALAVEGEAGSDSLTIHALQVLALVGMGEFQLAMERITDDRRKLFKPNRRLDHIFNYAMAEWGLQGSPPEDLFAHVIAVTDEGGVIPDANLHQCRALAEMVLGRHDDAAASLEAARLRARTGTRDFSCWRYLWVSGAAMLTDLTAMSENIGEKPAAPPPFFAEVRTLLK
jgi:cellulose biosynthesis protein BcsQ